MNLKGNEISEARATPGSEIRMLLLLGLGYRTTDVSLGLGTRWWLS